MQNIILSPVAISDLVDMIANEVENRLSQNSNITSLAPQPHIKGIHSLAKFLGISVSKAQRLKNEGIIPFFQNERLVLFDPDKVREAMTNYNKKKR